MEWKFVDDEIPKDRYYFKLQKIIIKKTFGTAPIANNFAMHHDLKYDTDITHSLNTSVAWSKDFEIPETDVLNSHELLSTMFLDDSAANVTASAAIDGTAPAAETR